MSIDGIAVNYGSVNDATSMQVQVQAKIQQVLDDFYNGVKNTMAGSWEGDSAAQFDLAKSHFDSLGRELVDAFKRYSQTVENNASNFSSMDSKMGNQIYS